MQIDNFKFVEKRMAKAVLFFHAYLNLNPIINILGTAHWAVAKYGLHFSNKKTTLRSVLIAQDFLPELGIGLIQI